jgi:hypothetical protein
MKPLYEISLPLKPTSVWVSIVRYTRSNRFVVVTDCHSVVLMYDLWLGARVGFNQLLVNGAPASFSDVTLFEPFNNSKDDMYNYIALFTGQWNMAVFVAGEQPTSPLWITSYPGRDNMLIDASNDNFISGGLLSPTAEKTNILDGFNTWTANVPSRNPNAFIMWADPYPDVIFFFAPPLMSGLSPKTGATMVFADLSKIDQLPSWVASCDLYYGSKLYIAGSGFVAQLSVPW